MEFFPTHIGLCIDCGKSELLNVYNYCYDCDKLSHEQSEIAGIKAAASDEIHGDGDETEYPNDDTDSPDQLHDEWEAEQYQTQFDE